MAESAIAAIVQAHLLLTPLIKSVKNNSIRERSLNMPLAPFLQVAAIPCCLMSPVRTKISQDMPFLLSNQVG